MRRFGSIGIIVIVLGAVLMISQSLYIIDETESGIVLQFEQIQKVVDEPGIYVKTPFIQRIVRLDNRVLTSDTVAQEYLTSDEKRIVVDQITRWRISDAQKFYVSARTVSGGRSRLEPLVLAELRGSVASYPYDTMISIERDRMMQEVKRSLQGRINEAGLGITIVDVRTKRADLPQEVEENVYLRMASARKVEADRYRAQGEQAANEITAETDRLVSVMRACAGRVAEEVRGQGDAAAIAIFAQGLSQDPEFYSFNRKLESYEVAFADQDKLVLSTDSDFFKLLTGEGVSLDPQSQQEKAPVTSGAVVPLDTTEFEALSIDDVENLIDECIPPEASGSTN